MIPARQSTARTIMVGPVLDADGVAVTGGVVADMKLSKNGAAPAALDASATLTHRHTGFYSLALTANDLDTVGTAQVTIDDTVNSCAMFNLEVIEEAVYDALFAASANAWSGAAGSSIAVANVTQFGGSAGTFSGGRPEVNTTHWKGTAGAAVDTAGYPVVTIKDGAGAGEILLTAGVVDTVATVNALGTQAKADVEAETGQALVAYETGSGVASMAAVTAVTTDLTALLRGLILVNGTIGSTGNDTTHVHLDGLTYGDDEINSYMLAIFDNSQTEYHVRSIDDWVLATELATVSTLPFTPENGVDAFFLLSAQKSASGLDAAGVRAAVGLASANLDTQLADLPTNAELATSQASADDATLAAIAAADAKIDIVDTVVDAIKVKTDFLPSATAGAAGGVFIAGSNAATTANITGNLTGNVTGSVGSVTGAVGSVTGAVGSVTGDVGGNVVGSAASVTGAVGSVTGNVGGNVGGNVTGSVGSLAAQAKADVNAEVVDVVNVDTFAEPTGVPAATTTIVGKIGRIYQAQRNRVDVTGSTKTYADDAGNPLWKKSLSDDGTTYVEAEGAAP